MLPGIEIFKTLLQARLDVRREQLHGALRIPIDDGPKHIAVLIMNLPEHFGIVPAPVNGKDAD